METGKELGRGDGVRGRNNTGKMCDVTDHGRGFVAETQRLHAQGGISLGEAYAIGIADEGYMGVDRRLVAEEMVKIDLGGGAGQQVVAAHYFRDTHKSVVGHNSQLVGPGSIGATQKKITEFTGQINILKPVNHIGKDNRLVRHEEAPSTFILQKGRNSVSS